MVVNGYWRESPYLILTVAVEPAPQGNHGETHHLNFGRIERGEHAWIGCGGQSQIYPMTPYEINQCISW